MSSNITKPNQMPSKQELFAMAFKTGAYKASKTRKHTQKKSTIRNKPTFKLSECPSGWTPPKPKPKTTTKPFSLFRFAIEDYHTHF